MQLDGKIHDYLNFYAFKKHCIGTEYKFTYFPKNCFLSNKRIWLEKAYKQTAMWTGPGDPVFESRWYNKDEYLIAKIKGEL